MEFSFDIVSEINWAEVTNAVDQTRRELSNRFDFKGSKSELDFNEPELTLLSDDKGKLQQLKDVFESKLIKRGIALKALNYSNIEPATGGSVRQKVSFIDGIEKEVAKKIQILIKNSKIKVKATNMDQKIRVAGKSKDDLQSVMNILKEADLNIPLQFINYR